WRMRQKEISAGPQPGRFQNGSHDVFRRARIRSRFQTDKLTRPQATRDFTRYILKVLQIGRQIPSKRSRHANNDDVQLGDDIKRRYRTYFPRFYQWCENFPVDVGNITF